MGGGRRRGQGDPMVDLLGGMMSGMVNQGAGGARVFRSGNGSTTFTFSSFGGPQGFQRSQTMPQRRRFVNMGEEDEAP